MNDVEGNVDRMRLKKMLSKKVDYKFFFEIQSIKRMKC